MVPLTAKGLHLIKYFRLKKVGMLGKNNVTSKTNNLIKLLTKLFQQTEVQVAVVVILHKGTKTFEVV